MATDGLLLLRMLEPPVRPDGVAAPIASPPVPIEARGFEAILAEAQESAARDAGGEATASRADLDPLRSLAQLDRVENGSVRAWMAARPAAAGRPNVDGG